MLLADKYSDLISADFPMIRLFWVKSLDNEKKDKESYFSITQQKFIKNSLMYE